MGPITRKASTIISCIVLAALFVAAFPLAINKDMSDFGVCYKAGQRVVGGEMLYRASDGHLQYKYAPVAADFYALFGASSWGPAKLLWYILSLGLLAGSAALAYRMIPPPKKPPLFLLGLTFLIMVKCLARELQLGQVNILIICLLVGMSALFLKKRDFLAGAIWGVSLLFKPYALVFLPYFLLKKRFRVLAGGTAALVAGLALPIINFGFHGNLLALKAWAASLSQSTPGLLTAGDNASLFGFVLKLSGGRWTPGALIGLGLAGIALGVGLLVLKFGRGKTGAGDADGQGRRELAELAYLLVLIPLFSPLGWNYNYLYGFLAVMLVLDRLRQLGSGPRILAIVNFVLIGATLRETLGRSLFNSYTRRSLVALNFVLLLFSLAWLRVRPAKEERTELSQAGASRSNGFHAK